MSNQSHSTGQRQDAAKRRREYLAKKTGGLSMAYILGLCSTAAGLLTPFLFLGAMLYDDCMEEEVESPKPQKIEKFMDDHRFFVPVAAGAFALGSGLLCRFRKALPYVPSIEEQLDALAALPPEAILVRGSDQPSATPDELLRAAHSSVSDPAEELLRAEVRTAKRASRNRMQ